MAEPRKIEIGDVLMDKKGYRYEVKKTGIRCNFKNGVALAYLEVEPVMNSPKDLFVVNDKMETVKRYTWQDSFFVFLNIEELKRKAGFVPPDDEKYIIFIDDCEYAGTREYLSDVIADFIKKMPFDLSIGYMKEFSNRFRNVVSVCYEDDSASVANDIADEIDKRLKELEAKEPISQKSTFMQDIKPD
ncbi:MAG: hypothetical protein D8H97_16060 [Neisseria sp.]|nr:MAG: hypothetical protein D8H97_16060 [Neisseria sp.]